jgi:hypothetical protein
MTELTEQRWRFQDRSGRVIWLPFDPDFLCIYCEQPVSHMSMSGPAVCGSCDCGCHADGSRWTPSEAFALYAKANRRLDELPTDPIWAEYEAAHRAARPTPAEGG